MTCGCGCCCCPPPGIFALSWYTATGGEVRLVPGGVTRIKPSVYEGETTVSGDWELSSSSTFQDRASNPPLHCCKLPRWYHA